MSPTVAYVTRFAASARTCCSSIASALVARVLDTRQVTGRRDIRIKKNIWIWISVEKHLEVTHQKKNQNSIIRKN